MTDLTGFNIADFFFFLVSQEKVMTKTSYACNYKNQLRNYYMRRITEIYKNSPT